MTVFEQCYLFLRNPRGGVEDLVRMKAAGFNGVFCNIGDFAPFEWDLIRQRAGAAGMFCGPWARTQNPDGTFSEQILDFILTTAALWGSPLIVNPESELKGTGDTVTKLIAEKCEGYDAGLSVEPIPFDNVSWVPVGHMPVLPQLLPPQVPDFDWIVSQWHAYGVKCVWPSYSSWGGAVPGDFPLNAPYGVYTADDMGGDYAAWSPVAHTFKGCVEDNGGNGGGGVTPIGPDHGIRAMFNRLRDMDPSGTLLVKGADGKWPPISTLEDIPVKNWKAYDKAERANTILVQDHDAGLA